MRAILANLTVVVVSLALTGCYVSRRGSESFGSPDANGKDADSSFGEGLFADGYGDLFTDMAITDLPPDLHDTENLDNQGDPDGEVKDTGPELDTCLNDCVIDLCADKVCDDGDHCNGEETCDPETGDCLEGESPIVADEFLCTIDECASDTGEITHTPSGEACISENPCLTGMCDFGSIKADDDGCVFEEVENGPNEGCSDQNPCTSDSCLDGACDNELLSADELSEMDLTVNDCICVTNADCEDLEDGDLCNGTLLCDAADEPSVCGLVPGSVKDYDDGEFCNGMETCDPATGEMVEGEPPIEDDGIDCTVDSCDEETDLVVHAPTDQLCDDENPCTDDACDAALGCIHTNNSLECDDEDFCTTEDLCVEGECIGVTIPEWCDDDNFCTEDICDPVDGCKHNPLEIPCDDNDACTVADLCGNGSCEPGAPLVCDNSDACDGEETCDSAQGCIAGIAPICDDANICNGMEGCDATLGCQSGESLDCNDENPCTDDSCDPEAGCLYVPSEADCDDGDECTIGDACALGECAPGLPNPLCEDFDHDGLGLDDSCPYAFDPQQLDLDDNGQPDACESLTEGFTQSRPVVLSQEGTTSTWRRTNEPVEIPLANGIIDDSVVGYWKLDDGNAIDHSGKDNHGLVSGPTPLDGASPSMGSALSFDGLDDFVEFADESSFDLAGSFTISAWTMPEDCTPEPYECSQLVIVGKRGYCDNNFAITSHKGRFEFEMNDTICGGGWKRVQALDLHGIGVWHHVAAVLSGSVMQLYVDGVLQGEMDGGPANVNNFALRLGSRSNNDKYYRGAIDDVLIFDRALTPDEIATYFASKAPYGTKYAAGSQADFDDVRVTETVDDSTYVTRSRVIGPRPHSDTPCPMAEDDGSWGDREDLCGVVGYWQLDGSAADVAGLHSGENYGAGPRPGRFGEPEGAMSMKGLQYILVEDSTAFHTAQGTWEAWVLPNAENIAQHQYIIIKNSQGEHNDLLLELESSKFRAYHDHPGGNPWFYSDAPVVGGRWYHVAFSWDGAKGRLYVNGILNEELDDAYPVESSGNPIIFGGGAELEFHGAIDEVIIHSVAKSPDYIYNRANPGVPKVRFLANTVVDDQGTDDDPSYPLREYSLHWGDGDTTTALPFVGGQQEGDEPCYGLLNGCLGYAGWWRFNEGGGNVAVDVSGNKLNASSDGPLEWVSSMEGTGMKRTPNSGNITSQSSPLLDLVSYTVEALALPDNATSEGTQSLVTKAQTGPYDNYRLQLLDGQIQFQFEYDAGGQADAILTGSLVPEGEWFQAAASFDSGFMSLILGSEEPLSQIVDGVPFTGGNEPVHFGSSGPGGEYFGALDSVRISNRALASDEFLHYPLVDWTMTCTPDCAGKACSDDGCGGSCDLCASGNECSYGSCVPDGALVVPNDHLTIQDAVNAAPDGGTVVVAPGTYVGSILVEGKSLHIQSTGGAFETKLTWDGEEPWGSAIEFAGEDASGSSLEGFWVEAGLCGDNPGYGVRFGQGSDGSAIKDVVATKNIVTGSHIGYYLHHDCQATFMNSILVGNTNGIFVDGGATAKIFNNVLARGVVPPPNLDGCKDKSQWGVGATVRSSCEVRNNIFFENEEDICGDAGFTNTNNLSHGAKHAEDTCTELFGANAVDNVEQDPLLIAPDDFDYQVGAGSPAVDSGASLLEVTDDFAGVERPQGAAYDIGAYEAVDTDHDSQPDAFDSCPYAFDPQELDLDGNGQADACEALGEGFTSQRAVVLSQEGNASTWRRTNEPVEIPLANGIIDDSVVGYWKLDDDSGADASGKSEGASVNDGVTTLGAFGSQDGALAFEGVGSYADLGPEKLSGGGSFTVSTWIRSLGSELPSQSEWLFGMATSGQPEFSCKFKNTGEFECGIRGTAGASSVAYATAPEGNYDGYWHHVAVVWQAMTRELQLYIDGKLSANGSWSVEAEFSSEQPFFVGSVSANGGYNSVHNCHAAFDDFAIFNRALSPDEIGTYYVSKAPYGTKFAIGPQADFDDVRVTETGDDGSTFVTRSRIIGPRPHSDTPCPMAEDDGSWGDREDLCGVFAYWPLNDDAQDVMGVISSTPKGQTITSSSDRFGDAIGAYSFDGNSDYILTDFEMNIEPGDGFTAEAWALLNKEAENTIMGGETKGGSGFALQITPTKISAEFADTQGNSTVILWPSEMVDSVWHHYAVVKDPSDDIVQLFVDGLEVMSVIDNTTASVTPGHSVYLALKNKSSGEEYYLGGKLDEVIIHSVAKSPDYIYNRANPGVPKVRFLANTVVENQGTDEAPKYSLREYSLRWGDGDATMALPFVAGQQEEDELCYGLLNSCLGYAGWWRFNDDGTGTAVDASAARRHAAFIGTTSQVDGIESLGLKTGSGYAKYDGSGLDLEIFTVESSMKVDSQQNGSLFAKYGGGDFNYRLEAYDDGALKANFEMVGGGDCYAVGDYVAEEWTHNTMRFDGTSLALWTDGELAQSTICPAGPLTTSGLFHIGTNDSNDTPFTGAVDSVRISSRALSPDEMLHYPLVDWEFGDQQ